MSTMAAARLHEVGGRFQLDQVPVPVATGSDVLVRVRACGVVPNLKNVITSYPEWFPFLPLPELPAIYGLDPAGEVAAVGPDVIGLEPGQRVYVNPMRPCGTCHKCRMGKTMACESLAFAGYFGFAPGAGEIYKRYPWGGLAEYMVAPSHSMVVLPDKVSYEQAARFGYLGTSYGALRRGQVGPDTVLLVNGATGTLGVGAILLALGMGVPKILAVARNREILAKIAALAPGRIVTYSTLDGPCTDWARAQTGGFGPDVVLDALGPEAPPEASLEAMLSVTKMGKIVTIGGMDKDIPLNAIWLMCNLIDYLGSCWFTTGQATDMAHMVQSGAIRMNELTHRCFPLEQVNDALDAVQNRALGGFDNVVVTM